MQYCFKKITVGISMNKTLTPPHRTVERIKQNIFMCKRNETISGRRRVSLVIPRSV